MAVRSLALTTAALAALLAACGRGGGAKEPASEQAVILSPENVAVVAEATLRSGPEISGTLRAKREAGLTRQFSASAARTASSTARRFSTGSDPGSPRHTGHVRLFGAPPKSALQSQNILLSVSSSA